MHYVTPQPTVSTWTDLTLEQERIIERMAKLNISMHPNVALSTDGAFSHQLNGETVHIEHAQLVFAGARTPNDGLFSELKSSHTSNLYRAGDCVSPGIIQAAVLSGRSVAETILNGGPVSTRREQIALQW